MDNTAPRELPVRSAALRLYNGVRFGDGEDYDGTDQDRTETFSLEDAQVVSSEIAAADPLAGQHLVLLDLDVPARLVPSSTPGHSHLYIEVPMPWHRYERLLEVLADVGIVQPGYVQVSRKRKATMLRLPWVRKAEPAPAETR